MSSTNRGSIRSPQDYYCTPITTIQEFWKKFCSIENKTIDDFPVILDLCAGGDEKRPCAYTEALKDFMFIRNDRAVSARFFTVDIREDSKATYKCDYLTRSFGEYPLIISNPPFLLFEQFVKKSLTELTKNGYLIYLLRLNAAGGQKRRVEFWNDNKPKAIYIHSKDLRFAKDLQIQTNTLILFGKMGVLVKLNFIGFNYYLNQKNNTTFVM